MFGTATTSRKRTAPLSILVVEHCETLSKGLRCYLEFHGHRVAIASDLKSAAGKLSQGKYDVLLSDVYLPDGVCSSLLKGESPLPPFVATMSGFDTGRDEVANRGAVKRHLVKPFSAEELDSMLDEFCAELAGSGSAPCGN
jgi:DNA-binding response OmpR family regulator